MRTVPSSLGWAALASLALAVVLFAFMPRGQVAAPLVEPVVVQAPPQLEGAWTAYLAPERDCPGGDDPSAEAREQERTMLCLVNYARARQGLAPAVPIAPLLGASALKARDIDSCGRFDHDPCGTGARRVFELVAYGAGSSRFGTGENIAIVSADLASPRRVLNGWLNSDGHRENLFRSDWSEQGVALLPRATVDGHADVNVWVSQFGFRDG